MKRKITLALLIVALAVSMLPEGLSAQAFRKPYGRRVHRAAAPAPAPDTAKKPTKYEKFVKKKGLKKETGYLKLYTDGTDVWLEIPDSLTGRKLILSTVLKNSSDPWIEVGQQVSSFKVFQIGRTDSLLVLFEPARLPESADSLERATLRAAAAKAIRYAFPIDMRNADTTAVVVKATKLFDPSNKDVIDIQALLYGENSGLIKPAVKSELTLKSTPVRYGSAHLGVQRELTLEGDDGTFSRNSVSGNGRKARISGNFVTMLSLVPDRDIPVRNADPRVGVRRQSYRTFSSEKGVKTDYDAVRWNLAPGDHITVYIDTLFPATRRAAIRRGLEAWNAGFRQAGLGDVIRAVPYPRDKSFCADDPFICKVVPTSCDVNLLRSSTLGSGLTGGILGATITVPQGYLTQMWRQYAFRISEADQRFATLFPKESALCEILAAGVMRSFGNVLGLSDNLAGSAAYSPEQLRDGEFTATHGITASVMDQGAMFNTLARPGDRRSGVPTVSNQIGTYDKYAIEWLYKIFPEGGDAEALKALVDSHEGDPEYLYLPEQGSGMMARDVRARSGDLGNDPMAEYNARMSTLKYVAKNALEWLNDPRLENSSDRYLFYEWLWLGHSDAIQLLAARLGGVTTNPVGSGAAKFTPVDKKNQKEYIKTIFSSWRDRDWIEADRELLHTAGAVRSSNDMAVLNSSTVTGARSRINNVFFAWKEAGSDYTPDEYLTDFENELFRNAASGRLDAQEDQSLAIYMAQTLIAQSPVLRASYDRHADPLRTGVTGGSAEDLFTPVPGVPTTYLEEMDILCKQHLERVRNLLRQGRSRATDADVRGRLDFLIHLADTALDIN